MNWVNQFDKEFIQKLGRGLHIENIEEEEWTSMKWFVRGFIAGIKTNPSWQEELDDHRHDWDNTVGFHFLVDDDKVYCEVYDEQDNFEELNYEDVVVM